MLAKGWLYNLAKKKFFLVKYHSHRVHKLPLSDDIQVAFDLKGEGNCQFETVSDQFQTIGINRTASTLRHVDYITHVDR